MHRQTHRNLIKTISRHNDTHKHPIDFANMKLYITGHPKTKRPFVLLAAMVCCAIALCAKPNIPNVLNRLDSYVQDWAEYATRNDRALKQMEKSLSTASPKQQIEIYEKLVCEYRHVNVDSALRCIDGGRKLAKEMGDSLSVQRFNILEYTVLPIYGLVKDAIDLYERLSVQNVYPANKELYFNAGDLIYKYAADFYRRPENKQLYADKSEQSVDSLLKYMDKSDPEYRFQLLNREFSRSSSTKALKDMEILLHTIPFESHLYARTAAIIGQTYLKDSYHIDQGIYYLALSAMSDIATGNRETTSLHRLGKLLYDRKDIERSYEYLTLSLAIAVQSGSRLRSIEIAEALPLVFATNQEMERTSARNMTIVVIALSILLIVSGVLMLFFERNRRRLARMKVRLQNSVTLKDQYIRKILSLCGVYLSALEDFNRIAGRKIKAGQVVDLLNMIESGKIMRDQLQNFYEVFDSAFLMVYPDFVNDVNKLFEENKQVAVPEGERLTPELRILAFMRLGLDDSSQISKFLGLSLNTIYTYRNKMKTRARDRDLFEQHIRNIGSIE